MSDTVWCIEIHFHVFLLFSLYFANRPSWELRRVNSEACCGPRMLYLHFQYRLNLLYVNSFISKGEKYYLLFEWHWNSPHTFVLSVNKMLINKNCRAFCWLLSVFWDFSWELFIFLIFVCLKLVYNSFIYRTTKVFIYKSFVTHFYSVTTTINQKFIAEMVTKFQVSLYLLVFRLISKVNKMLGHLDAHVRC